MLIISLKDVNFRFDSLLGCSGRNVEFYGLLLSPAILISRLLLLMRSQHSFGLPLRMNGKKALRSCMFQPSSPRNLIMHVLMICHSNGAKAF